MLLRPEKRRRCCPITSAGIIPDDVLIYNVLVHLPAKSLARCRCVCRSWRAEIAGAAFVRRHRELSRARPPSALVIPRKVDLDNDKATSGEITFHRLPLAPPPPATGGVTDVELLCEQAWPEEGITGLICPLHADGLVAIATATDRVFVCNPATREFVALPHGRHNAELDHCELLVPPIAFGFDQWRNRYVVARYFYRVYGEDYSQHYDDVGHEVFTLGGGECSGGEWELTEDPPRAVGPEKPICTRRAFYWHSGDPQKQPPCLMRFGLQDRRFAVVPHPPSGWNPLGTDAMAGLDDGNKLCYVYASARGSFQVWMADDNPDLEWSLRCRIDIPGAIHGPICDLTPVMAAHDGKSLVATVAGDMLCRYNVRDDGQGIGELLVDMHYLRYGRPDGSKYKLQSDEIVHYVVPYIESLVSIRACNY